MTDPTAVVTEKIEQLRRLGNELTFTAIRREKNKLADELANQALDQK